MTDHLRLFMFDRQMKNEKGFTMIEMLIAMALAIVLLGAAIYTYSKQDKLLREETRSLQTRDYARLAMDRVLSNLLLAGYGFPPGDSAAGRPARGILNADATTITYVANTENISTYASFDSSTPTNTGLVVADPTVFADEDQIVFFDVETPYKWNSKTYNAPSVSIPGVGEFMGWAESGIAARNDNVAGGIGGCVVGTDPGCDGTYMPVTDNAAVEVNQYHTIIYTYNAGLQTIIVQDDMGTNDGGTDNTTTTVASKVSDLTFTYFDADDNALTTLPLSAADLGEVRKIGVSITVVNDDDTSITALLLTDINLRNMGI